MGRFPSVRVYFVSVFRIADHVRADICNGLYLCLVQAILKTLRPSADRPLAKSQRRPFLITVKVETIGVSPILRVPEHWAPSKSNPSNNAGVSKSRKAKKAPNILQLVLHHQTRRTPQIQSLNIPKLPNSLILTLLVKKPKKMASSRPRNTSCGSSTVLGSNHTTLEEPVA